jgi:mono/diheme cytochrome c family protein
LIALSEINAKSESAPSVIKEQNPQYQERKEEEEMTRVALIGLAASAFVASQTVGWAQEASIGAAEFKDKCAVCHGLSGKGDGPMAGITSERVADLTTLAKENQGVFPVAHLYDVIDGRTEVKWHGTRDMPVWGSEFNGEAPEMLGPYYTPADAEAFARGRILALIEYIYTLQEK